MKILVLNAGSSSQKSCLYDLDILPSHPPQPIWAAGIDWTVNPDYGVLTVKAKGIKQEINLFRNIIFVTVGSRNKIFFICDGLTIGRISK